MRSIRIRFAIRENVTSPSPPLPLDAPQAAVANRFWEDLVERIPALRELLGEREPSTPVIDTGTVTAERVRPKEEPTRPVIIAEREIRTRFALVLADRLRELLVEAGGGASAGAVSCRVENISYGSLEIILNIIGSDIFAQVLQGSLSAFIAALEAYAAEAFDITFPGTERYIVTAVTASPALIAAFAKPATFSTRPGFVAQQPSAETTAMWRRQWQSANAALLLPAMMAFVVLLALGFYLLHLAHSQLIQEREVTMELLKNSIEENRVGRSETEQRARSAEAAALEMLSRMVNAPAALPKAEAPPPKPRP